MWFTEDAWPPIILFVMIGLVLAFIAHSQQRPRLYVAAVFMGILCGMTYFIEKSVVTEREKIEDSIYDLARAFQENDQAGTLNYISPQNAKLQLMVIGALAAVDIDDDYRITDLSIQTSADDTLAQSHFRANVTATVLGRVDHVRQPTRWKVMWRKEDGKWRITEVHQLDPINGQELTVWEQIAQ
jgi:hypothetical protein